VYIGHGRLCVCLSVHRRIPTLLHGPGCNLGEWYAAPSSWENLQSVHGFRCYDNIHVCKLMALYTANAYSAAERETSASASSCSMAGQSSINVTIMYNNFADHRLHVPEISSSRDETRKASDQKKRSGSSAMC